MKGVIQMAGKNILTLTDDNFAATIKSNNVVLVDFWAAWCGPCKMIGPIVEEIAGDFAGKLTVGKLNVDENRSVSTEYGIMSIPTLLFFKNGEIAEKIVGYKTKADIAKIVEKVLQ